MSRKVDSKYSEYLSELHNFEQSVTMEALEDFEGWKEKVKDTLEGCHRIRFNRLKFYEKEEPDFNDEIPF
jgi:hypothetical protein